MPGAEPHARHGDTLEVAALPLRDETSGRTPGACLQTKCRPRSREVFDVSHINIRSFIGHAAELNALIQLRKSPPAIVSLNGTWLDESTEQVELEGYELVARQEGQDDRKCGGIIVFARADSKQRHST